jgi:hypothetical protein
VCRKRGRSVKALLRAVHLLQWVEHAYSAVRAKVVGGVLQIDWPFASGVKALASRVKAVS